MHKSFHVPVCTAMHVWVHMSMRTPACPYTCLLMGGCDVLIARDVVETFPRQVRIWLLSALASLSRIALSPVDGEEVDFRALLGMYHPVVMLRPLLRPSSTLEVASHLVELVDLK